MSDETERISPDDKAQGGDVDVSASPFLSKLSNFWFYHKWKVIIAFAALLLIAVSCRQSCRNADADIIVVYAGSCSFGASERAAVAAAYSSRLPSDFNGDGAKTADFTQYQLFSEKQIEEKSSAGAELVDLRRMNTETLQNLDNLMSVGEYPVVVCERWIFERYAKNDAFVPLSEVLSAVPEGTPDAYCVSFSQTSLAAEYPDVFKYYTEDTVVCLRRKSFLSGSRGEAEYNHAVEFFRELVK